jgi:hypothetical protein
MRHSPRAARCEVRTFRIQARAIVPTRTGYITHDFPVIFPTVVRRIRQPLYGTGKFTARPSTMQEKSASRYH